MKILPKEDPLPPLSLTKTAVFYTSSRCHYPSSTAIFVPVTATATIFSQNKYKLCPLQSTTLPVHGNDANGTVPLISDDGNNHSRIAVDFLEPLKKQPLVEIGDEKKLETKCGLCGGTRYVILLIAVLSMTAARANEMTFNLTVICMTSNSTIEGVIFCILHLF